MLDSTILVVTRDNDFLELLRQQIHDQSGGGSRMIVATTIDEACSLLTTAIPRLIVLHWARQGTRYEELDRLLWTTTVLARRVPVLVIADRYRTDQATTLYRMGVSEYISRSHHLDQFGRVLGAYVPFSSGEDAITVASAETPAQPVKAWGSTQTPPSVTARVV